MLCQKDLLMHGLENALAECLSKHCAPVINLHVSLAMVSYYICSI